MENNNYDKNYGSFPLSFGVLKQSRIGLWAAEIDEGCPPRMYGDDAMKELLGITSDITPEEMYHAWYDYVDDLHYPEVDEALDQMVNGQHAEVQYPWHYPDGRVVTVRCGGVRNYNYTKGVRVEGVHRDVTELMHLEKEKLLQESEKEKEQILLNFTESYDVALRISMSSGKCHILKDNSDSLTSDFDTTTYLELSADFVENIVYEADKSFVRNELSIEKIKEKLNSTSNYSFDFRCFYDGIIAWNRITIISLDNEQIAIGIVDLKGKILLDALQEKSNKDYVALFTYDFDSDITSLLKPSSLFPQLEVGTSVSFRNIIKSIFTCLGNEGKSFFSKLSKDYVLEIFEKEDKFSFTCEGNFENTKRILQLTSYILMRHEDGTPKTATFGFSFVDTFGSERQFIQNQLNENMSIIEGLSTEYNFLCHIDLQTNAFNFFVSKKYNSDAFANFTLFKNFDELYQCLVDSSMVHPDFKDDVRSFYKDSNQIKEVLKDKKSISKLFKCKFEDEYLWTELIIIKCDDIHEEAQNIIMGFCECDSQTRNEQIMNDCLAVLGKDIAADKIVDELLSLAGKFYGANRVKIFEYYEEKGVVSATSEWCSAGIESNIKLVQNIPAIYFSGWVQKFQNEGVFAIYDYKQDPDVVDVLKLEFEKCGVNSAIIAPIMKQNKLVGICAADNPQFFGNLEIFKVITNILYSEVSKRREYEAQSTFTSFFLDSYYSAFYVDLENHTFDIYKDNDEIRNIEFTTKDFFKRVEILINTAVHPEDRKAVSQALDPIKIRELLKTQNEISILYRAIETVPERIFNLQIVRGSDENHAAFGFRDVSNEMREQQENRKKLEEALAMAESSSRAKTTFLSNMSHDIRTPMNAIIGFTGLAENHIDEKSRVQEYLSKIGMSSKHLLSLINDVLDMSRIESGKINIEPGNENLLDIIEGLKNIVEADVDNKGLSLSIDTDGVSDENIVCDRLRLNQILLNVLSNSIKYTNEGGKIDVVIKELPKNQDGLVPYEFIFTDNGIGMSQEFLKTIFEPFTRYKSSTVTGIQGTGLGMSITKSFVEIMGGSIDIQSEENKGTRTSIVLPFEISEIDAEVENIAPQETQSFDFKGKKVLLVEDNLLNSEIAYEILTDYGFIVDTLFDGKDAVEKIKKSKRSDYDIILMDVQMPIMDGYEATKCIRSLGREVSNIPIIAITANAFEEDCNAAIEAGMNAHIAKPINYDELLRTIGTLIYDLN